MVGHGESSASSYLADPTSLIPSHWFFGHLQNVQKKPNWSSVVAYYDFFQRATMYLPLEVSATLAGWQVLANQPGCCTSHPHRSVLEISCCLLRKWVKTFQTGHSAKSWKNINPISMYRYKITSSFNIETGLP